MLKFLLGVAVGSIATATYMKRQSSYTPSQWLTGGVDELSSAADNLGADPTFNAGDGTPRRIVVTDQVI